MQEQVKHGLDALAAGTAFASLTGMLPSIASLLSIVWLTIQIVDWVRKKRNGGEQ